MVFLFLFVVGVLAPVVHNLCTPGFFWFLYKVAFYRSKKKNEGQLGCHTRVLLGLRSQCQLLSRVDGAT